MNSTTYHIKSYCSIKNGIAKLNGNVIFESLDLDFKAFIKAVYKNQNTNYPKFFKMDNLSKLAFLASDILLQQEQLSTVDESNIAILLSNNASSLDTDRKHQESIQNKQDYYPSPAVFVYTLPNICIGEISIKYKLYSENSFFIFEKFSPDNLSIYCNSLLQDEKADEVLCGWVNYDTDNYEAFVYLVSKKGEIVHNTKEILTLYNA
ncbi:MAG: 3-oxoacyl-ACP synthase [Flavobacteriaceae bacterium]|mgnify:CR=1 FL=1